MSKQFDYLIFIGRFQIVHKAHVQIILNALSMSERVIVICGSAFQPRTPRNPFTVTERWSLIQNSLAEHLPQKDLNRVMYTYSYNYIYNDQMWIEEIQEKVKALVPDLNVKVGIIGHKKDRTSFYLDLFPQWKNVEVPNIDGIGATWVREAYFEKKDFIPDMLPDSVISFLREFKETEHFQYLKEEYEEIKSYRKSWEKSPYKPIFVTTDAVVIQSGHILLIKRKVQPGKGNYALPGGFLGYNETIEDSMIRELREETKLKLPVPIIKGSIKDFKVFGHPGRSLRGRTITHAYLIEIAPSPNGELCEVKGGDDAEKAFWIPLSEIDNIRDILYEDHADIIRYFVSRV